VTGRRPKRKRKSKIQAGSTTFLREGCASFLEKTPTQMPGHQQPKEAKMNADRKAKEVCPERKRNIV